MTRRSKTGFVVAVGLALAGGLAAFPLSRAAAAEEARAAAQEAGSSGTKGISEANPRFRPGILGLKMVDVRDEKLLWREIEQLQQWERADRISVAEYRSEVIEKTADFLRLGGITADEFATAATGAIAAIRESFFRWRLAGGDPKVREAQFSSDMNGAVTRVTSLLQKEPRHQLFAQECKKWLLKLAFGPKEAKEAKEAKRGKEG